MKAVIMAGGEGTRLRPLTCDRPKPMATLLGVPALEIAIGLLCCHGLTDIALTLKYLPKSITDYFGDGKRFGAKLSYFVEDEPLGTAGSVKNAEGFLDEDFLIISGDALCDLDLGNAIDFHYKNDALVTIVLKREEEPLEYGVAVCSGCEIKRFVEKPAWPEVFSDTVNTGVYVMNKSILSRIPAGRSFDFSKDLFPEVLKSGGKICGYVSKQYWCDIGDIPAYLQGNFDLLSGRLSVFGEAKEKIAAGMKNKKIYGVTVYPPSYIAESAVIQKGSEIGPYAVVEDGAVLSPGCRVKHSIIQKGAFLGRGCEIKGAVICDGAELSKNVSVFEGAVVGEQTTVGEDVFIAPGTKIWPHKKIDRGEKISRDVVWGETKKQGEVLWGGVYFDTEKEVSLLEFIRFGRAVGRLFSGGQIVVASDGEKISEVLKDMVCAGILSAGSDAVDARSAAAPPLGRHIRGTKKEGGVYLSKEGERAVARVYSANGLLIAKEEEKKLERLLEENETAPKIGQKSGHRAVFDGLDDMYLSEVSKAYRMKNTIPVGIRGSGRLFDLSRAALFAAGADVVPSGGKLNLVAEENEISFLDENEKEIPQETLQTLLTSLLCDFSREEVLLPASFPFSCERVLRERDKNYRLVSKIPMIREENAVYFDPVAAALFLARALSRSEKPLSALISELPGVYYEKRGVFCDHEDKGRVMRFLIEETGVNPEELAEGVTVLRPNGAAVRIIPNRVEKRYDILAEAFSEEYAKELAADLAEKIRKVAGDKNFFQN